MRGSGPTTVGSKHASTRGCGRGAGFVCAACRGHRPYSLGRRRIRRSGEGSPRGQPSLPWNRKGLTTPRMGSSCKCRRQGRVEGRQGARCREGTLRSGRDFREWTTGESRREVRACGLAARPPQSCDQAHLRGRRWVSRPRACSLNQKVSRAMPGSLRGDGVIALRRCQIARGRGRRRRECIHNRQRRRLLECLHIHLSCPGS